MEMKKAYCLLILFISSFTGAFAQNNYEAVNIYITPFGSESFVEPDATPDYLRVHAETKISSSDSRIIREIYSKLISLKKEKVYSTKRSEYQTCHVVIDLVEKGRVRYSIAIDDGFQFIVDDGPLNRDVIVYKEDKDLMCFLKNYFPQIIEMIPMIDCSKSKK